MKVSIITGTYNSARYIADCVRSVAEQTHGDIEHIIIDGASKDTTVEIINAMPNRVAKLVSEPDKGIYNAMNKGLRLANGTILGILNSDDFYTSPEVLAQVVGSFEATGADCVFGNLYYVEAENTDKIVRKWVTGPYTNKAFAKGWHPAHPSFFVKREVYEKYGYFDESLHLAADFELMLRFIEKHKVKWSYLDLPLVRMRLGGATSKSLGNIIKGNKECLRAFQQNDIDAGPFYTLKRLGPKLKQFF